MRGGQTLGCAKPCTAMHGFWLCEPYHAMICRAFSTLKRLEEVCGPPGHVNQFLMVPQFLTQTHFAWPLAKPCFSSFHGQLFSLKGGGVQRTTSATVAAEVARVAFRWARWVPWATKLKTTGPARHRAGEGVHSVGGSEFLDPEME